MGWMDQDETSQEEGLGPGQILLDGDPALLPKKQPTRFGPCLLWPNGCMDQDAARHGGNIVGRINKVTLRRARLVLGWVTVFGG